MILYLDTSALVPLLIEEPTSPACGEAWDRADTVVSTRLAYVEAAAGLAMAERMGRISGRQSTSALANLRSLWLAVDIIELDLDLMETAAEMAVVHSLRGYDSIHCAAARTIGGPGVVATAGDARLVDAWQREGIAVLDTRIV